MKKTWIKIKRGLIIDPKHRKRMGELVWVYFHMLDRADWETGAVEDWKDADEAEALDMKLRTLRDHRQKLDKLGYVTNEQKQRGLRVVIHNYTNPREYSGQVYNPPEQGDKITSPTEIQADMQGDIQGISQDGTPTYNSQNHRITGKDIATAFDEFREITGRKPRKNQMNIVSDLIMRMRLKYPDDYMTRMKACYREWLIRAYKPENLNWLAQWALEGKNFDHTAHQKKEARSRIEKNLENLKEISE